MSERIVNSIEGVATSGPFFVETIAEGNRLVVMRVRLEQGVGSETHAHDHESVIFVLEGRVASVVDGQRFEIGPGESSRHPEHVPHRVEALEDSVFLEVKSPAPDLATVLAG